MKKFLRNIKDHYGKHKAWLLLVPIAFYICGAIAMPVEHYAREECTFEDSDGEEHESHLLIRLEGVGKVLAYHDVYLSSVWMLLVSPLLGMCVWQDHDKIYKKYEFHYMVFGNYVIGVALIALTTRSTIWPTVLFWLGAISGRMILAGKEDE